MTASVNPATVHGAPNHCAIPNSPLAHAREGLDKCVHCGFCLQACPTYVTLDDENDSPRGRLVLMRSMLEGSIATSDEKARRHLDQCLGCRACETACPSGVPYGHLLEATRATLTERHPLPWHARLLLSAFRHRRTLQAALWLAKVFRWTRLPAALARILPERLGFPLDMLASTTPRFTGAYRPPAPADGRGSFALLEGCVMRGLYAHTNAATQRTLAVNGYREVAARGQECCGALHAHAGNLHAARELARRNIEAFERSDADFVVSNAAGCGAMLKEYGQLLADDPAWATRAAAVSARARDVSELLAAVGPVAGAPLSVAVTYDAPCHLLHAQRISAPPLKMLAAIPGLRLVPLTDAEYCCGAAGIYNLLEPDVSAAVLRPKLGHIATARADYVATGNPGCLMQIGAGLRRAGIATTAIHPVELLDASYAARFGSPGSPPDSG
jgi:glycolate oxidase iron-sulfur subunit